MLDIVPKTIFRRYPFTQREQSSHTTSHTSIHPEKNVDLGSRIQQAFYSLIPQSELPEVHLKLSRVLYKLMEPLQDADEGLDEATIFVPDPSQLHWLMIKSICNHVNQCLELIDSIKERVQYASLNNICGEKYLNSAAFEGALTCIQAARQLLRPELEHFAENTELARSISLNLVVTLYR
jgi:hypothetical protein